ncbi:uncharacterized protein LAESUDRAFT_716185 [Laetiporus sulphureus 93-53]|uniref:Uncharacterized protein n=1 Tax=Laetiporus sulphureus 93-53 TaxID=1314785 RepID=A0A165CS96_9APHY|nr:uncharacterized protein LAESUDRAFT_716185 [Laetiporus sulphureus 93-53]KZT03349.1 hypothetical protein LAESUDRAFT_716185 [Laetiporus sulphureus 93-53]
MSRSVLAGSVLAAAENTIFALPLQCLRTKKSEKGFKNRVSIAPSNLEKLKHSWEEPRATLLEDSNDWLFYEEHLPAKTYYISLISHRQAHLRYQQYYNASIRASRRKLSKRDQAAAREKMRQEAHGLHCAYDNPIAHKSKLQDLKSDFIRAHGSTWLHFYLTELDVRKRGLLISRSTDLHCTHQLVAIYHQEFELLQQGAHKYEQAITDHALTIFGRGVNKTYFKKEELGQVTPLVPIVEASFESVTAASSESSEEVDIMLNISVSEPEALAEGEVHAMVEEMQNAAEGEQHKTSEELSAKPSPYLMPLPPSPPSALPNPEYPHKLMPMPVEGLPKQWHHDHDAESSSEGEGPETPLPDIVAFAMNVVISTLGNAVGSEPGKGQEQGQKEGQRLFSWGIGIGGRLSGHAA